MASSDMKQITLRVPESLYHEVRRLAREKRVSFNKLAQESLERLAQESLAREMKAAYEALAEDQEEEDVEIYLPAQSEVVLHESG